MSKHKLDRNHRYASAYGVLSAHILNLEIARRFDKLSHEEIEAALIQLVRELDQEIDEIHQEFMCSKKTPATAS